MQRILNNSDEIIPDNFDTIDDDDSDRSMPGWG